MKAQQLLSVSPRFVYMATLSIRRYNMAPTPQYAVMLEQSGDQSHETLDGYNT